MDGKTYSFDPNEFAWQGLTLTPAASAHIRDLVAKQPGLPGIRLDIKQTGCAGFGYTLEMVTVPRQDDLLYEFEGARLWVAFSAMPFIDGTEVDYVRDGLNQIFKFNNPKVQHECGCGESFGV